MSTKATIQSLVSELLSHTLFKHHQIGIQTKYIHLRALILFIRLWRFTNHLLTYLLTYLQYMLL